MVIGANLPASSQILNNCNSKLIHLDFWVILQLSHCVSSWSIPVCWPVWFPLPGERIFLWVQCGFRARHVRHRRVGRWGRGIRTIQDCIHLSQVQIPSHYWWDTTSSCCAIAHDPSQTYRLHPSEHSIVLRSWLQFAWVTCSEIALSLVIVLSSEQSAHIPFSVGISHSEFMFTSTLLFISSPFPNHCSWMPC